MDELKNVIEKDLPTSLKELQDIETKIGKH